MSERSTSELRPAPKRIEEQSQNAIGRLQAGANQVDVARHMEVCRATTGFVCGVCYNNTGSSRDRPRLGRPRVITPAPPPPPPPLSLSEWFSTIILFDAI